MKGNLRTFLKIGALFQVNAKAGKGSFRSKNPHFPCVSVAGKEHLSETSFSRTMGEWGFKTPEFRAHTNKAMRQHAF